MLCTDTTHCPWTGKGNNWQHRPSQEGFTVRIQNVHHQQMRHTKMVTDTGRKARGTYQFRGHFLNLGDEVSEELSHVLLLARVQWLVVHDVHLAEALWVVRLAFTLLKIRIYIQNIKLEIFFLSK